MNARDSRLPVTGIAVILGLADLPVSAPLRCYTRRAARDVAQRNDAAEPPPPGAQRNDAEAFPRLAQRNDSAELPPRVQRKEAGPPLEAGAEGGPGSKGAACEEDEDDADDDVQEVPTGETRECEGKIRYGMGRDTYKLDGGSEKEKEKTAGKAGEERVRERGVERVKKEREEGKAQEKEKEKEKEKGREMEREEGKGKGEEKEKGKGKEREEEGHEKRYGCEESGKAFTRPSYLKQHSARRIHFQQAPQKS
ncbi:hypothetical protein CLOP_g7722 [Closterium sp. NIES-67]|nr:hypothetical protein CLOP_g7722 [Closterium sp. NIES-67]